LPLRNVPVAARRHVRPRTDRPPARARRRAYFEAGA
jgi:hypothetical protein